MIFDFDHGSAPLDLSIPFPRAVSAADRRPERELLVTALRGVDVRILLHAFTVPLFLRIVVGIVLFPYLVQKGHHQALDVSRRRPDRHRRDAGVLRGGDRTQPRGRGFKQPVLNAGVLHAKMMMMDREPHAQHRLAVRPELRRSPGPRHRRVDSRRRDRLSRSTTPGSR